MGRYRDAIAAAASGAAPDVTATRAPGRTKLGVELNLEQQLARAVRAFARAGRCDGSVESFAYTEADDSIAIGLRVDGAAWGRDGDRAGVAAASSGLAPPHRDYLARGGLGFVLGDGSLRYGREAVVEAYYTARVARGTWVAADVQAIRNPGYDRDRGPVWVGGVRLHAEL
jgi:high affinity Mn2+ porin